MSNLEVGIVGLPNVGKSTLFNAITKAGAEAANFPFCTIEPNVGVVAVPDARLNVLHEMYSSKKTTPASVRFVDIAGLVKGASKGEGLGNKFLEHIRQVDAVAHVVRCFVDENITHVEGGIDPLRDIDIIQTELCLADLEVLEKRIVYNEFGRARIFLDNEKDIIKEAMNFKIQSAGASILNRAIARIQARIDAHRPALKGYPIMQIHDQLVYECPDSEVELFSTFIREEMTRPFMYHGALRSLRIELTVGKNFGEV